MTDETQTAVETASPEIPVNASEPPVKRGRGRPRKDGSNAAPVSPSEAGAAQTGSGKRGPGRPKKNAKVSFDGMAKDALAKQINGLHQLVALATGIPELQIGEQESVMLADAVANVCEEYDLSLSGKTGALLQLAAASAMIYAPRFIAVTQRIKKAQAQKPGIRVVGGTETEHAGTP